MGAESRHICIIGGGVIGLCSAYYCAKRGHRVTVVDREPEGYEGCSHGNAGMICPSHVVPLAAPGMVSMGLRMMWNPESPFYIKPRLDWDLIDWGLKFMRAANAEHVKRSAPLLRDLHLASRACFEELDEMRSAECGVRNVDQSHSALETTEHPSPRPSPLVGQGERGAAPIQSAIRNPESAMEGGFGLVKRGLLMLCRTQHTLDEEAKAAEHARSLGVPADVLDAKQTAKLDPGATLDIAGAVHYPKDCHLSPNRFMAALRDECGRMGVTFMRNEAAQFTPNDSAKLCCRCNMELVGGEVADEFVVCAGAWSGSLVSPLGLRLPIQAGKGYSVTLPTPRQLPHICHILTEARVAVTPMGNTLRFGGTMEIAGLNEDINAVRVNGIIKSALKYYPEFHVDDFRGVQPWCGLRPCSPDGLPYLGRTAKYSNLTLAAGHAMMGLSLGPITGRLVAEVVSGEKPSIDLTLLNPDRYG